MILALLLLAGQPAPAVQKTLPAPAATSPAALAAARKILVLMQVDRMITRMFDQLVPLMSSATVGALEANAATAPMIKAMADKPGGRDRLLAIFAEEFTVEMKRQTPLLLEQTAKEYAAAFEERELNELIAFYSSGTGEKVVALMPELQQRMPIYGQQVGRAAGETAGRRAVERAMAELMPSAPAPRS